MEFNNITPLTPESVSMDNTTHTFNIPLYQRLFEWSEPQLKGLLSDLLSHFLEGKTTPYFIGMMTGNETTPVDLIDGQQRFTTIMLLAIVLRDFYDEWNKLAVVGRLTFSARPNDNKYLESLIKKECVDKSSENKQIRNGCEIIRHFVESQLPPEISKEEYAKRVFIQLTFFVNKLPSGYCENPRKLNQYFEAMNSSGRSLEQHEKLKVDLLSRAGNIPDKSSLNNIWNICEKMHKPVFYSSEEELPLSKVDNSISQLLSGQVSLSMISEELSSEIETRNTLTIEQIRVSSQAPVAKENIYASSSIINFEELLLLALDITLGQNKNYNRGKLEERFHALNQNEIPNFYKTLIICRLVLDRFIVRVVKEGQRNRYVLKISESESDKSKENQLRQYQSMLYASGSSEVHLWLTPYVKWIIDFFEHNFHAPNPEMQFEQLRKIDESIPSHKFPDVDILRFHKSASIYLFQRLDYILWERCAINGDDTIPQEYVSLIKDFTFSTNRSVEHFQPQNESHNEAWPDNYDDVIDPINTFGNLALISSSFNSEQSNDNENLKIARIAEHIDRRQIQSIKLLLMYDLAIKNNRHWSVDIAVNHGKKMMEILKKSYL